MLTAISFTAVCPFAQVMKTAAMMTWDDRRHRHAAQSGILWLPDRARRESYAIIITELIAIPCCLKLTTQSFYSIGRVKSRKGITQASNLQVLQCENASQDSAKLMRWLWVSYGREVRPLCCPRANCANPIAEYSGEWNRDITTDTKRYVRWYYFNRQQQAITTAALQHEPNSLIS